VNRNAEEDKHKTRRRNRRGREYLRWLPRRVTNRHRPSVVDESPTHQSVTHTHPHPVFLPSSAKTEAVTEHIRAIFWGNHAPWIFSPLGVTEPSDVSSLSTHLGPRAELRTGTTASGCCQSSADLSTRLIIFPYDYLHHHVQVLC
jgi:hypothetical protein